MTIARSVARAVASPVARAVGAGVSGLADDTAYFSAVEGAGGSFDLTAINASYTPTYIKNAISDFIDGLKSDGAWSLLDEYYLFCAKDWDGRLVKLKGFGLLSSTGYTSSHWTAAGSGTGLQGGGLRTISSGFTPSSSEDISMGGYITALTTSTGTYYVGQGAPAVGGQAVGFTSPSSFRIYRSGASVSTTSGHQVGSFCYTRRGATDHEFYSRGASIWTDNAATLDAEAEFRVGQFFSLYHNGKLATAWIGRGISGSVANAISNREQTLLTAIGGNAY